MIFNYLKPYRESWNLKQKELAYLLGIEGNKKVSFLEAGKLEVSYRDALTLELLFRTSAHNIFPDLHHDIANDLFQRLITLEEQKLEMPQTKDIRATLGKIHDVKEDLRCFFGQYEGDA